MMGIRLGCIVLLACCGVVVMPPAGTAQNVAQSAALGGNWPCVQPFVGALSAGTYWNAAPPPPGADWRGDARIAALVDAVAPRDVPLAEAQARLAAFAQSLPEGARAPVLAEMFQGLVEATNAERNRIVARIEDLAHRQRELSMRATQLAAAARAAPPDLPATEELVQRRDFAIRMFQEAQRTMRYACEVPPAMDARLGQLGRWLQDALGD